MKQLARRARPGAAIASYTVATSVRAALAEAGFACTLAAGFGRKRHRLVGRYAPPWRTWPAPANPPAWPDRRVLVVGAGLAGWMVAGGFAAAGWSVVVAEARVTPLGGGSGQPRLATHLHLSPDDNRLARLTRAALGLRDRRALAETSAAVFAGKLIPAAEPATRDRQRALVDRAAMPAAFARLVDADEAGHLAGIALPHGGLWLPRLDAADPRDATRAIADGPPVDLRLGTGVATIEPVDNGWLARRRDGGTLGAFPLVVLACAGDAVRLGGWRSIALRPTRGQSTVVRSPFLAPLRCLLGGDAYACPLDDGEVLVGSTFDERIDLAPDPADDASNLRRLARTIGVASDRLVARRQRAVTGLRYAPRDRLPLVGWAPDEAAAFAAAGDLARNARLPLPRSTSLMLATGFGARGALWAPLAAQLLPALAEGWALPVESDLAASIDPCRFLRSALLRAIH
jgi:tRNA 5-methylaminomethyl-2-thiouridine biosynthesis bifunctional protein